MAPVFPAPPFVVTSSLTSMTDWSPRTSSSTADAFGAPPLSVRTTLMRPLKVLYHGSPSATASAMSRDT